MKTFSRFLLVLLVGFFFLGIALKGYAEAPALSLKDSIAIAEDALAIAKIKLDGYYLYGITFSNSSKGNYWYYTYRPVVASERNQVFAKVYMDRTTDVTAPEGR